MRVLLTGGGTGGHVNPALAIGNMIKQNDPNAVIGYVGTPKGIENKLVPEEYKMYHVDIQGIRRSLSIENIKTVYLALTSPKKAKKIIKEFKPDIVIGTGGYVCWPVIKAASECKIPTALHESNVVPGVAVKALLPFVDRVYVNFKETENYLSGKGKLLHVGNPLKNGFSSIGRDDARKSLGIPDKCKNVILSYGGSLGADKINEAALFVMREFSSKREDVYHVHATGTRGYSDNKALFDAAGLDKCGNLKLEEYIYDMPTLMAAADVVVCRAGAMTVSELAMSGKCAIFIPSPNVTNNHQYKNAKVLADAGAALLIEEKDLDGGKALLTAIDGLLSESGAETCNSMRQKIQSFAVKDANKRIYLDIKKLLEEKSGK